MSKIVEILSGKSLSGGCIENAFKEYNISAKNTFQSQKYEVWELYETDFKVLCDIPESEWKENYGWFRSSEGMSDTQFLKQYDIKINGIKLKAYYDKEDLDEYIEGMFEEELVEKFGNEEKAKEELTKDFFKYNGEFDTLLDYTCDMLGASQPRNVCAIAIQLARINNMTMGELLRKTMGQR